MRASAVRSVAPPPAPGAAASSAAAPGDPATSTPRDSRAVVSAAAARSSGEPDPALPSNASAVARVAPRQARHPPGRPPSPGEGARVAHDGSAHTREAGGVELHSEPGHRGGGDLRVTRAHDPEIASHDAVDERARRHRRRREAERRAPRRQRDHRCQQLLVRRGEPRDPSQVRVHDAVADADGPRRRAHRRPRRSRRSTRPRTAAPRSARRRTIARQTQARRSSVTAAARSDRRVEVPRPAGHRTTSTPGAGPAS